MEGAAFLFLALASRVQCKRKLRVTGRPRNVTPLLLLLCPPSRQRNSDVFHAMAARCEPLILIPQKPDRN
jgi:hypothetical protein